MWYICHDFLDWMIIVKLWKDAQLLKDAGWMTEWGTGAHTNMLLIFPLKILLYPLTTSNTEKTCKNLRKKVSFALYTLKLTSPGCHYSIKEQHHPHLTGKSTVSPCLIYKNMLLDSGTWDLLRHLVQLIAAVSLKQAFWN